MPTFARFSDRRLRKLIRNIIDRPTHCPAWDAWNCTQCRVLRRAIDEKATRLRKKQRGIL